MKENELYRALNTSITGCQPSDYWKNRMVRQIVKGEEMKKRTKLSVGAILVAALLLISAVGLAVGVLVNEYYAKVARMERDGALDRWQLEDKISFISTMKECNFDLAEDLYAQVMDESLPAEQREAAADRIINDTYGELLEMNLGYYETEENDVLGMAPDVRTVFDERYFADHPDWEDSVESMQAYFDALGHYLHEEIGKEEYEDTVPEKPVINEAYAVNILKHNMTEGLYWDAEAVEAMTPQVEWDEDYRMWTVSGEVSDESMEKATDLRKDMKPILTGNNIEKTETGYRYTILVDEQGRCWQKDLDKEFFRLKYRDEVIPVETISMKQAAETAEAAVKEKYHPDEAEWKEVFSDPENAGVGEEDGQLYRFDFHRHYYYYRDADLLYGAVVNMATGKVECMVSYRTEDQTPEWQLLEYAAAKEQFGGRYEVWDPESKAILAERIKACGLLPEDPYRQLTQPAEAETDAFVARAFGAEEHVSSVNVMGMLHRLMGFEETWSPETRILADRLIRAYSVNSVDLLQDLNPEAEEITAEAAARIIKAAVCDAWGMPGNALDNWAVVTRLVQDKVMEDISRPVPWTGGTVYYRVFLTRPDEEVDLDTFGGRDSMNYRITTDGTILTAEDHSGWYSPKEDMERWQK